MESKATGALCSECPLAQYKFCPPENDTPMYNKGPRIAFVGESPGADEIFDQIPFVGPSGNLFNAMLAARGIKRSDVLVTNATLCRPPKVKDDEKAEHEIRMQKALRCCRPRLTRELHETRATHALAMGKFARTTLWNDWSDKGITVDRGRWQESWFEQDEEEFSLWVLPTFHPAYILRTPENARDLFEDFDKFLRFSPKPYVPTNSRILLWPPPGDELGDREAEISGAIEVLEFLQGETHICFDLETSGYNWWEDDILMIGFCWGEGEAAVIGGDLLWVDDVITAMRNLSEVEGITWIAHNGKFDEKFMLGAYGFTMRTTDDTMIMHYALDERSGTHALKSILAREFDVPDYEQKYVFPYLAKKSDSFRNVPQDKLAIYCGMDVDYDLRLYWVFKERLEEEGLWEWPYKALQMRAANNFTNIEMDGIQVDWSILEETGETLQQELDQLEAQLREIAGKPEFNPSSPLQVAVILYDERGYETPRGRGIKPRSTNKEVLQKLKTKYPDDRFITWMSEHRKVKKLLSSYVRNLAQHADAQGKVHPNFLIHGTETGRLSARNPAIQTIPRSYTPRGKLIRDLYVPSENYVMIHADYKQAELCVLAYLSQDPFLLDVYRNNRDLHTEVAREMYGKNFTKEERVITKMFNFSWTYGGTEQSFAEDAGLPMNEARVWVKRYNENMPVAKAWMDEQLEIVRRQGFVQYKTGRKRRLPFITSRFQRDARKFAVNAEVQGTASDITLNALNVLHEGFRVEDVIRLLMTIHDSIIVECPDDDDWIKTCVKTMKYEMIASAEQILPGTIPFKVDVDIGYRWGSFVPYEPGWRQHVTPWWIEEREREEQAGLEVAVEAGHAY